jgi:hypothetical protein
MLWQKNHYTNVVHGSHYQVLLCSYDDDGTSQELSPSRRDEGRLACICRTEQASWALHWVDRAGAGRQKAVCGLGRAWLGMVPRGRSTSGASDNINFNNRTKVAVVDVFGEHSGRKNRSALLPMY